MNLNEFKNTVLPIKNKLFRFALSINNNRVVAEDIVQEVFIKVWNTREQLSQIDNLEAWCMKLTRNLTIDKMRSKHNRTRHLEDNFDISSKEATPHFKAEVHDTFNRAKKLINELPEKMRMVIQLRDIEEMTYKEISEILNMPISQVKINLFRARKQIRAKLIKSESYGLQNNK